MSYCAKCFENTMKLKFSEPNYLCWKEMIPISKCSKNRFPGYLKTVANQCINCLGAVPWGWKHSVQCYGASWDWPGCSGTTISCFGSGFSVPCAGNIYTGGCSDNSKSHDRGNSHLAFTLFLHNLPWTGVESKAVFWHPSEKGKNVIYLLRSWK